MTHRDHISLGLLVYSGTLAAWYTGAPESVGSTYALPAFAAFLGGVSFPDIDLLLWPHLASGHRVRSILHRLDIPIILTLLMASAAWVLYSGMISFTVPMVETSLSSYYYVPALIASFTFGWFTHLLGDVIQGGVRLGFGCKNRVGITSFKWDIYTGPLGTILSTFLKMLALSVFALFINKYGMAVFGNYIRLGIVAFLTVQAISFSSAVKFEASLFVYSVVAVCAAYGGLSI